MTSSNTDNFFEGMHPNKIQRARETMRNAFDADEDFKDVYIANIAMLMYDELHKMKYRPKLRYNDRNELAEKIVDLIFYDKR